MTKHMQPTSKTKAIAKSDEARNRFYFITMIAALVFISALILMPTLSNAQQTNTPAQSPTAGNVPGGSTGITSDSDLWRALKSGQNFTVSTNDKKAGVGIQTNGEDWRRIRNGSYITYSAWAILGTLVVLLLFFAVRGRVRIGHGGPSGQKISRFKPLERLGHWLLASSFIILALTGLNLVYGKGIIIPMFGKETFATLTTYGKLAHNYVAFSFMLALVWVTITWLAHNIPHPRDITWFLQGGGILGKGHPAARKFNAGQKVIFWAVILGGLLLSLSGWALLFPFTTSYFSDAFNVINSLFGTELPSTLTLLQEQQLAQLCHGIMSVVMVCIIIAHIYIGSVGMEGAIDAMTTGEVDRTWANEHHSLWVVEEDAREMKSAAAQPAE